MDVPASLIKAAESAIERVLGSDSELQDLWSRNEEWDKYVEDLMARVNGKARMI